MKKIAIICTGRELLNGKVHESSSHAFAKGFQAKGMHLESIFIVGDQLETIKSAIDNASNQADCLIVSGGLGPTSDDITRFAFASHIQEELQLHLPSLDHIKNRLANFNLTYSESNKQQALFPASSEVINNDFGTANGCYFKKGPKDYFLLPGPPHESQPMFDNYVINKLLELGYGSNRTFSIWRMLGPSESVIAPQLDALVSDQTNIETGFCYSYPYLDFIIYHSKEQFYDFSLIDSHLESYLINKTGKLASEELRNKLDFPLRIIDSATGGMFVSSIITAKNHSLINDQNTTNSIEISGLDELWANKTVGGNTELQVKICLGGKAYNKKTSLRYRGEEIRKFAVEYAAAVVLMHWPQNISPQP